MDVRYIQLCGAHLGGVKVQRHIGHTVQRNDAGRQLDQTLVVAARLKLAGKIKIGDGQSFQRTDGAGRACHAQRLLAERIMQAFHIKAVRRADEIHLERQLPHLINGQRHIGGVTLH